jgi:20S proteasome alpha/beta subunit
VTTIVGVRTPTAIVLAADRAVTSDITTNTGQCKLLRFGRDVVAFAGDCDRIARACACITRYPGEYYRACRAAKLSAVAVVSGVLQDIEWTGSSEQIPGYTALGSGVRVALGALHATDGLVKSARERALIALRAAAKHDTNTGGPFDVLIIWPSRQRMITYER